jgi:hypothetical protein
MLSIASFKLRATDELVELRGEVLALATDQDIYWKIQREVIQKNSRLLTMRSAFFDMMNDAYAHSTASRIRRLVDRDSRTISLRRLIEELASYPDLFRGKLTLQDVRDDLMTLDQTCGKVKDYVDQFVAHHDRKSTATIPSHHELNEAIDTIVATFKRYYAVFTGADIDVVVSYLVDPLTIFSFPWVVSAPGSRWTKP